MKNPHNQESIYNFSEFDLRVMCHDGKHPWGLILESARLLLMEDFGELTDKQRQAAKVILVQGRESVQKWDKLAAYFYDCLAPQAHTSVVLSKDDRQSLQDEIIKPALAAGERVKEQAMVLKGEQDTLTDDQRKLVDIICRHIDRALKHWRESGIYFSNPVKISPD